MLRHVLIVLALLAGTARANQPPRVCLAPSSSGFGYDGAPYYGAFGRWEPCPESLRDVDYRLLVHAAALVQLDTDAATDTDTSIGFARARLTLNLELLSRLDLTVTGDGAEQRLVDTAGSLLLYASDAPDDFDDTIFNLTARAGRMVVPFSLAHAWSDSNLPFLERGAPILVLAPPRTEHGASFAAAWFRNVPIAMDRADTENTLLVRAEAGVFRPVEAALGAPLDRDAAVIARAFALRTRNSDYKSLDTYLALGGSIAIGPDERRYAVELDARYYRYRATLEALTATFPTESGRIAASGASATISATIPINREHWWTEPLARPHIALWRNVVTKMIDPPNPGIELDLGLDVMRGDSSGLMTGAFSTTTLRTGAHFFLHDFAKLSVSYAATRARGITEALPVATPRHAATVRLQLAF